MGACLTIGLDGKIKCNQGIYNQNNKPLDVSASDVLSIKQQIPSNPYNQAYAFTTDPSGNTYAIMGSDTISVFQDVSTVAVDGSPIVLSLKNSYVDRVYVSTTDPNQYIQLSTDDRYGTYKKIVLNYDALLTQLTTLLDKNTATSTYAPINSPTFTGTVSGITAAMVGLGNVNNTSDADKPISNATQTALNLVASLAAPLASPTFTGTATAPTINLSLIHI